MPPPLPPSSQTPRVVANKHRDNAADLFSAFFRVSEDSMAQGEFLAQPMIFHHHWLDVQCYMLVRASEVASLERPSCCWITVHEKVKARLEPPPIGDQIEFNNTFFE